MSLKAVNHSHVCHANFSKVFWIFVLIVSSLGLILNIKTAYTKWNVEPTIALLIRQRNFRDFPFPSTTVCSSLLPRKKSKLIEDKNNYQNLFEHICQPPQLLANTSDRNITENIVSLLRANNGDKKKYLFCVKNDIYSCNSSVVLTEFGFCDTFNILSFNEIFNAGTVSDDFKISDTSYRTASEWSLENGYIKNASMNSFPVRAERLTDINYGYQDYVENFKLKFCHEIGEGYRIFFHLPNEIPTPFHQSEYIPLGDRKLFIVTATSYKTNENLRKFDPKIRECYFKDEKKLKFFQTYTKSLCDYECLTNYTLKLCGCVKFSMPHNESTKICNLNDGICLFKAKQWISQNNDTKIPCDCYPSCSNLKYSVSSNEHSILSGNVGKQWSITRLLIDTFKLTVEEQENYLAYTLQNFVADFGGLVGLFLGFSVLSLVEIIYQIICNCNGK
jgi:amiloride-sensitive sodium channel